jgi:pectinesterase
MAMKETLLCLSRLLALLVLGSLLAPSHQEGDFDKWVTLQQMTNVGKSAGGGKDPELTSAESSKVNNGIEPNNDLGGENGYYKAISESIANIPNNSTSRYVLTLQAGTVFREKCWIDLRPSPTARASFSLDRALIGGAQPMWAPDALRYKKKGVGAAGT